MNHAHRLLQTMTRLAWAPALVAMNSVVYRSIDYEAEEHTLLALIYLV